MTTPRHVAALDALALTLATALGLDAVTRDTAFAQPTADKGGGVALMVTLPNGRSDVLDVLLGAARPYEVQHATRIIVGAVGGDAEARRAVIQTAIHTIATHVEADRSLGGLVDDAAISAGDWQEVAEDAGPGVAGEALDLTLLLESETALG